MSYSIIICVCKNNKEAAARAYLKEKVSAKDHIRKANPEVRERDRKRKANPKEKDRKRKALDRNSTDVSRINSFKSAIKEGPYFICVVCNRCMYLKTVRYFDSLKYDLQYSYLFTQIQSFDTKLYICLTCHQNLIKNKIPCQSVWNKL